MMERHGNDMKRMDYDGWLAECAGLVRHETVWRLIFNEGDFWEAWETELTPTEAVRLIMLDVLAPKVGQVTWP